VENFDYDTGVEELDGVVTVHLPNGIPDAAELMALQAVLQNPGIETKDSGVSHMALWKIYLTNLAQAQIDLSAQSAAVQRAVAAYMTLGSFGHVGQVLVDVETHFAVTLDRFLYPNAGDRWFAADKDMDRDGVTNKQEWDYAVAQTAEAKSGTPSAAAAYVGSVPDPGEGSPVPPDLPPTGTVGDFASECAGSTGEVEVLSSPFLVVTAHITTPDGLKELVLAEGQKAKLPLGVNVRVRTTEAPWFSYWSAPNSLLDGSAWPSDSFTLTGDTKIRAGLKTTWTVEFPSNSNHRVTLNIAGGDEPLVLDRGEGEVNDSYIKVREGTLLSVVVTRRNTPITWMKLTLVRRTGEHAGRSAVIDPSDVKVVEGKSGYVPPHGLGTLSARGANSAATVNSNSGTKVESIVSETQYPIPHDAATSWESTFATEFKVEVGYYIYDVDTPPATNLNPNPTATAEVRPQNMLTVVEAECEGDGCVCDRHGSISLVNAKRYYLGPKPKETEGEVVDPPPTETETNGELVGIVAAANPGHVLKGFRVSGGGKVYKWKGSGQVEDFTSLEDMELVEDEDGLYVGDDLYVEMVSDVRVTPVVCLCIHHPTVWTGSLEGDTELVAKTGYTTFSENRFGCLHWTLEKIRQIGEAWAETHDYDFEVGRISQHGGGSVTPEGTTVEGSSHRNGLDVDVRYLHKDELGVNVGGRYEFGTHPIGEFDKEATIELINLFKDQGAILIIVDSRSGIPAAGKVIHDPPPPAPRTHDDHFHVRFDYP
jgi:hypothetical protein